MGASSAQALSLKLGGFAEFWVGYADNEKGTGRTGDVRNNFDVKHDMELFFRAEEKLDSGITVGALIELEAGVGNALGSGPPDAVDLDTEFDESFGWVKTSFGQINAGNNDNATGYVGGVRTVGPVGIFKSDTGDWLPGTYALNNTDVDLGFGDSQNITYFTPRVAGAQLIVSYTPDSSDFREGDFDESESAGGHHLWSGAVRFNRKVGGVGVGLAAGYSHAENTEGNVNDTLEGYNAAANISFGPARFTAAYAFEDLSGSREDSHWGASIIYTLNKMHTISFGYGDGESLRSATRTVDSEWYTLGWTVNMGKGASFAASVFKADTEDGLATQSGDNDGWGVVGGMRLAF